MPRCSFETPCPNDCLDADSRLTPLPRPQPLSRLRQINGYPTHLISGISAPVDSFSSSLCSFPGFLILGHGTIIPSVSQNAALKVILPFVFISHLISNLSSTESFFLKEKSSTVRTQHGSYTLNTFITYSRWYELIVMALVREKGTWQTQDFKAPP